MIGVQQECLENVMRNHSRVEGAINQMTWPYEVTGRNCYETGGNHINKILIFGWYQSESSAENVCAVYGFEVVPPRELRMVRTIGEQKRMCILSIHLHVSISILYTVYIIQYTYTYACVYCMYECAVNVRVHTHMHLRYTHRM